MRLECERVQLDIERFFCLQSQASSLKPASAAEGNRLRRHCIELGQRDDLRDTDTLANRLDEWLVAIGAVGNRSEKGSALTYLMWWDVLLSSSVRNLGLEREYRFFNFR